VNQGDRDGVTALTNATNRKHFDCLMVLLDHGRDPLDWHVPSALNDDAREDVLRETKTVGSRHRDTVGVDPLEDLAGKSGVDKTNVGTEFR
jgi:hypothetical protein